MESSDNKKYLGIFGAWALSFGCSVGWGSFVMPGTTFLPIAGPVGTAIGLGIGLEYHLSPVIGLYAEPGLHYFFKTNEVKIKRRGS